MVLNSKNRDDFMLWYYCILYLIQIALVYKGKLLIELAQFKVEEFNALHSQEQAKKERERWFHYKLNQVRSKMKTISLKKCENY